MKPGPFGPGGKFTFTQTCEWFDGNLALICRSDAKMPKGSVKGLSVMGWDPTEKTYTYFETNTLGENAFFRGTVQGDTWIWDHANKLNGNPVRSRYTLRQVSPDSATYKFEMGAVDQPMKLVMDGTQIRVK